MVQRRFAFIGTIIGIALLAFLTLWPAREISMNDWESLADNEKVVIIGNVKDIRDSGDSLAFKLDGAEFICRKCDKNIEGKEVEILGVVEEFDGRKRVRVLKIVL